MFSIYSLYPNIKIIPTENLCGGYNKVQFVSVPFPMDNLRMNQPIMPEGFETTTGFLLDKQGK